MVFIRQNRLLRDHLAHGLDVLLIEKDGNTPFLFYLGKFACSSYDIEPQPVRKGNSCDAIVFTSCQLASMAKAQMRRQTRVHPWLTFASAHTPPLAPHKTRVLAHPAQSTSAALTSALTC